MSRSRRKTPISGITTADSDAVWKKQAARKLRHKAKILTTALDQDTLAGKRWDVENPWSSCKDGKFWFGQRLPKLMRK